MRYGLETVCVQGDQNKNDYYGAVSVPIFQTASFAHPALGESTGYDYTRLSNPTRHALETTVAKLESGVSALAFSSGMAAIDGFMQLFKAGDHIIAGNELYGGTPRLFENISRKNGIETTYIDTTDVKNLENAIQENTKAVFIETPTNPLMKVTDIKALAEKIAGKGIILAVDNTFMTPYFQKPLELGADVVIHSGTKYLSGHNDTICGFTVTNNEEIAEKLKNIYKTTGACLSPFDSWLVLRGIKTLAIRMREHERNAVEIAKYLKESEHVTEVYFIGFEDNADFHITKKQCTGFGGMISFRVKNAKIAENVLKNVKLIRFAESLGGVETLITYPCKQTHAELSEEKRQELGVNETLLRLSVGIENVEDLINDLEAAFVIS